MPTHLEVLHIVMNTINNKYKNWYYSIIDNARTRILEDATHTEIHHVIPLSLGGTNDKLNLVRLTVKEHVLVHRLLTKFLIGVEKAKMMHAYFRMITGHQGKMVHLTPYQQKIIMTEYSEARRVMRLGSKHSDETKRKMSESSKGRRLSEEAKTLISEANRGRLLGIKRSEEFCQKISSALKGKSKTKEHSDKINKNPEKIKKTAEKHRGMKRSEESKKRMSDSAKARIIRQGGAWNRGMKMVDGKYSLPKDSDLSVE